MRARRSRHALTATVFVVAAALLLPLLFAQPAEARFLRVVSLSDRADGDRTVSTRVQLRAGARGTILRPRIDLGDADGGQVVYRTVSVLRAYGDVLRELRLLRRLWPRIDEPDVGERWP